jgi:hypothetical protein
LGEAFEAGVRQECSKRALAQKGGESSRITPAGYGAGYVSVEARQGWSGQDDLPVFDLRIRKAARSWEWSVFAPSGEPIMRGRESRRAAARYEAARALFLLLLSAQLRIRKA